MLAPTSRLHGANVIRGLIGACFDERGPLWAGPAPNAPISFPGGMPGESGASVSERMPMPFQSAAFTESPLKPGNHSLNSIRIGQDEVVPVWHLYLRQGFCVHDVVLADQLVEGENVSSERVDLAVSERTRRVIRHRPADVVENRGSVSVVVGDGLRRVDAVSERRAADQRSGARRAATLATLG